MGNPLQRNSDFWQRIRHYCALMRLNRPIGIGLLLWPCWWGVTLAHPRNATELALLLGWFAVGAAIMRSAGCVINDLTDQKIDAQVARTQSRPLAAGTLTPYQALSLLAWLLSLALLVVMQLHSALLAWAAASLVLVATYPWMKRLTFWPQAFLGLTFNLGALFGWIAVHGSPALPAFVLYAAGICWTIGYDTLYAHQDIEDDLRVGVKSTAIRFGRHSRKIIAGFYAAFALLLGIALHLAGHSMAGVGLAALVGCHTGWQLARVKLDQPARCLAAFRSNGLLGGMIWLVILLTI